MRGLTRAGVEAAFKILELYVEADVDGIWQQIDRNAPRESFNGVLLGLPKLSRGHL